MLQGAGLSTGAKAKKKRVRKARPVVEAPEFDHKLYAAIVAESPLEPRSVREATAELAVRTLCASRALAQRQTEEAVGLTGDEHRALASYVSSLRRLFEQLAIPADKQAEIPTFGDEEG